MPGLLESDKKIPPDILRRLKAGEDVPGYVVDRRPVQVPRGTSYGADAEFMNDPSGAMTTLIYKSTGSNTWKSNGDTADVYDENGNFIGVSSGDSNALALTKFIASSVAAYYGTDYLNGLESGAADLGGGDLFEMSSEGVNFGSESVGNGLKANASNFGPTYETASAGIGSGGGGGAGFWDKLIGSVTAGDLLKTGLGVAGVVVSNNNARDLAEENRQFTTDQTKATQDFTATENQKNRDATVALVEKKDEIEDKNKADDRAYAEQKQKELWARMMPVDYQRLELKAIPGAQPGAPTLNAAQPDPNAPPAGLEGGGFAIHNSVAPPGMRWDPVTSRYVPLDTAPPATGGLLNQDRRRFG